MSEEAVYRSAFSSKIMQDDHLADTFLQTTASESALIAVIAARSLYQRKHPEANMNELVIYTTTQTHSLGKKAGLVLGLPVRALEVLAVDQYSLRGATLRRALEDDTAAGKHPFALSKFLFLSFSSLTNLHQFQSQRLGRRQVGLSIISQKSKQLVSIAPIVLIQHPLSV